MEFNFKFLFPCGIGKSERGRHNVLSRLPLASVAPMSEVVSLFTVFSPHLSAVTPGLFSFRFLARFWTPQGPVGAVWNRAELEKEDPKI